MSHVACNVGGMSNKWVNWAWAQECRDPSAKLVLVCLADHAGHDGVAWPGTARLGDMTGLSSRTIRRWLDEFEDMGLITRTRRRRSNGTLGTYEYQLVGETPVTTGQGRPLVTDDTSQETPVSGRPADMGVRAEPPDTEPPVEPPDYCRSDSERLCHLLADLISDRGGKRPHVTKAWITDMERLIRIDGRSPDDIERVLRWLGKSEDDVASFWRPNVRSPEKLRLRWDQMREQYQSKKGKSMSGTVNALQAYLETIND